MNRILYPLFATLLCSSALAAGPQAQDAYVANCRITPEIAQTHAYPGEENIVPSNKLALPAGKSAYAEGQLVFLSGRVLDENCVPVSGAIIDIWQADPQGKYRKSTPADRASPFPAFAGTGRAITDNLGHYNFVTLFPGIYGKRAPHINVRIIHKDFTTLDTELFFANDHRNASDAKLKHVEKDTQSGVLGTTQLHTNDKPEDGVDVRWDITLAGKNPYRKF